LALTVRQILLVLLALLLPLPARALAPCSAEASSVGWSAPQVLDAHGASLSLDSLVTAIADDQVVFIAELHDRFDHHLNQLELICRLARRGPVAIGLEFFQTPFQAALDAYINDHGDLQRLLRDSEWFTRWGFDPRLYAPILRFARSQRIPLLALNVPAEIVAQVSRHGMQALDARARMQVPASVHEGPRAYRERLKKVFEQHPGSSQHRWQNFLAVQLLWDEGMAQRAADYLLEHPRRQLLVLAGEGHIAYGDAIPDRLARRIGGSRTVILQAHDAAPGPAAFDYKIDTRDQELGAAGKLGLQLDDSAGSVRISGFTSLSAARDAGLQTDDRIVSIDGLAITDYADLRLALWQKMPGHAVALTVQRGARTHTLMFELR
jgi:uncharacterized iron-regulated protein